MLPAPTTNLRAHGSALTSLLARATDAPAARAFATGLLGLVLVAAPAHGQSACTIDGPAVTCGESVELCGPTWGSQFEWTLPDGSTSSANCVTSPLAGTYTLRVFDAQLGRWVGPCTHVLAAGSPSALPAIDGPDSVCVGEGVGLCGPDGFEQYQWGGPNGLVGRSVCLLVGSPGVYTLRVRATDECWSETATWTLREGCVTPPPPPPPSGAACPRAASWWAASCRADVSRRPLGEKTFADIASCIEKESEFFAWQDAAPAFCSALRPHPSNLRTRAKKQVAAVFANVCAPGSGAANERGEPIGLDRATAVTLEEWNGTVGDWLVWADGELARLDHRNLEKHDVKRAYRRVIRTGWSLNHGYGVENGCLTFQKGEEADLDDRLEVELGTDEPVVEVAIEPNPVFATATVSFSLPEQATDVNVGVYDISGRLVKTVARGSFGAGFHTVAWDGSASDGTRAKSGVYFVIARAGGLSSRTQVAIVR